MRKIYLGLLFSIGLIWLSDSRAAVNLEIDECEWQVLSDFNEFIPKYIPKDRAALSALPPDHIANVGFLSVALASKTEGLEEFKKIVQPILDALPEKLMMDYISLGGYFQSQETALRIMGFGAIYGLWDVVLPGGHPMIIAKPSGSAE